MFFLRKILFCALFGIWSKEKTWAENSRPYCQNWIFRVQRDVLREKIFFCENDFQFFSFWLEKLQKFRGENRRGSWSSFVRVQRTSWGAFSRNNHLFSFYFGICAKSMEFSSQVFIRVVYRTFYMFFVSSELFLANRYCNICCILILSRFQQSFFWPFLLFFSRVSKAAFRLSRGSFRD